MRPVWWQTMDVYVFLTDSCFFLLGISLCNCVQHLRWVLIRHDVATSWSVLCMGKFQQMRKKRHSQCHIYDLPTICILQYLTSPFSCCSGDEFNQLETWLVVCVNSAKLIFSPWLSARVSEKQSSGHFDCQEVSWPSTHRGQHQVPHCLCTCTCPSHRVNDKPCECGKSCLLMLEQTVHVLTDTH